MVWIIVGTTSKERVCAALVSYVAFFFPFLGMGKSDHSNERYEYPCPPYYHGA